MKKSLSEIFGNILDWITIVVCGGILIYGIIALIVKIFF